jgi:hypothetical protein
MLLQVLLLSLILNFIHSPHLPIVSHSTLLYIIHTIYIFNLVFVRRSACHLFVTFQLPTNFQSTGPDKI